MDIVFEMIYSLLLLFMVLVLGVSVLLVGLIEGLGELIVFIVKIFFGMLSDYFGKCKGLVVFGYVLGVLFKLLFVMVFMVGVVLMVCLVDCFGKGICGVLCDVLVVDIVLFVLCGVVFGLW